MAFGAMNPMMMMNGGLPMMGMGSMQSMVMMMQMMQMSAMMQMMSGAMMNGGMGFMPRPCHQGLGAALGMGMSGAPFLSCCEQIHQHCGGRPSSQILPSGPAGDVGNINVGRLVAALPPSRRRSAQQHFPYIIAEARKQGITNKAQLAYILATATHESGAGAHMEEFASGRAYEGRRSLGNTRAGDGVRFKGRGYVQLTGRRNYADWSRRLGIDLVSNPDAVKNPEVAARILVGGMKDGTFTGRRLGRYINGNQTDFRNARRVVNGTDRAGHIGNIAQRLMAAM